MCREQQWQPESTIALPCSKARDDWTDGQVVSTWALENSLISNLWLRCFNSALHAVRYRKPNYGGAEKEGIVGSRQTKRSVESGEHS
jgi:hypothetical protein